MMRSLYSAVSGVKNHQTRMDVIGNNVANVNTIGFKKSTLEFKTQFSQTLSSASGPTNATGGANPMQVGLGVTLGAIGTNHGRGSIQYTGGSFDMAIDGDGYFKVKSADGEVFYTRAGNFQLNKAGNIIDANGNYVQFFASRYNDGKYNPTSTDANGDAVLNPMLGADGKITIPLDETFSSISVTDAGAIVGIAGRDLTAADLANLGILDGNEGTITYNPDGSVNTSTPGGTGTLTAPIPSGHSVVLGYVNVTSFVNYPGLESVGNNLYRTSDNSGAPQEATAGMGPRGAIKAGSVEMSNVDLAEEMVNMIVTQRGLQANSRVITTSDAILEELVNLKR